jgi:hypothetical protein
MPVLNAYAFSLVFELMACTIQLEWDLTEVSVLAI